MILLACMQGVKPIHKYLISERLRVRLLTPRSSRTVVGVEPYLLDPSAEELVWLRYLRNIMVAIQFTRLGSACPRGSTAVI